MADLTMDNRMLPMLSKWQIRAWIEGEIENLRFNPDDGMLSYRLTSQPDSRIAFKIPPDRLPECFRAY